MPPPHEESKRISHHTTNKGFSFGSISPEFYQESALMPPAQVKEADNAYYGTAKNANANANIHGEVHQSAANKKTKKSPYMSGEHKAKFITSGVLLHDKNQEILVLTRHRAHKANQSEDDNYASIQMKRTLDNSLVQTHSHGHAHNQQFLSERESMVGEE